MNFEILSAGAPDVSIDEFAKTLKLNEDFIDEATELLAQLKNIIKPKVIFGMCNISEISGNDVTIGGMKFTGKILAEKLSGLTMAFPYVATCGREIYDFSLQQDDPLLRYWVDAYAEMSLGAAYERADTFIKDKLGITNLSAIAPGSLPEWPLQQQAYLFGLLGDVRGGIGVELTNTYLMLPHKSISGIAFESSVPFVSCSLCPRINCPNRRAEYVA